MEFDHIQSYQSIGTGHYLKCPVGLSYGYSYLLANSDWFLAAIDGCIWENPTYSCQEIISDRTFSQPVVRNFHSYHRPRTRKYDAQTDFRRYSNAIGRWQLLNRALEGRLSGIQVPSNEKDTDHLRWNGTYIVTPDVVDLIDNGPGTPDYQASYYAPDCQPPRTNWTSQGWQPWQLRKVSAVAYEPVFDMTNRQPFRLLSNTIMWWLDTYAPNGDCAWYHYKNGFYHKFHYHDFHIEYGTSDTVIEYNLDWQFGGTPVSYAVPEWGYAGRTRIELSLVPGTYREPTYLPIGEVRGINHDLECRCTVKYTYDSFYGTSSYVWAGTPAVGSTQTVSRMSIDRYFTTNVSVQTWSPEDVRRAIKRSDLGSDLELAIFPQLPDLRPACYVSTSNALDNLLVGGPSANMLEIFKEYKDLTQFLPSFKEGWAIIRKLVKNRFDFKSWNDLRRFVTGEYLKQKFGGFSAVETFLTQFPRFLGLIGRMQSFGLTNRKGYGSFTYTFAAGEIFPLPVRMIVKTKIVVNDLPFNDVLESVLGLKNLGVLPSPSNLWDLVPLSFVLDWFLNVGNQLRQVENIFLLACMDVRYYTHTFHFIVEIPYDYLNGCHLKLQDGDNTVDLFIREISTHTPLVGSSRFSFSLPKTMPDWQVPVALITH